MNPNGAHDFFRNLRSSRDCLEICLRNSDELLMDSYVFFFFQDAMELLRIRNCGAGTVSIEFQRTSRESLSSSIPGGSGT